MATHSATLRVVLNYIHTHTRTKALEEPNITYSKPLRKPRNIVPCWNMFPLLFLLVLLHAVCTVSNLNMNANEEMRWVVMVGGWYRSGKVHVSPCRPQPSAPPYVV